VDILDNSDLIGRVVRSIAGRDVGKYFIIVKVINDKYVLISDGKLRTEEKPKKKKLKHLFVTHIIAYELKNSLLSNNNVTNAMIRKFLQLKDIDKEV
jgi:ribosomal protein L14E/L6E/L27E